MKKPILNLSIIDTLQKREIRKNEFRKKFNLLIVNADIKANKFDGKILFSVPLLKKTKVLLPEQIKNVNSPDINKSNLMCVELIGLNIITNKKPERAYGSYTTNENLKYIFEDSTLNKTVPIQELRFSDVKLQIEEHTTYNSVIPPFNVTFTNKKQYENVKIAINKAIAIIESITLK